MFDGPHGTPASVNALTPRCTAKSLAVVIDPSLPANLPPPSRWRLRRHQLSRFGRPVSDRAALRHSRRRCWRCWRKRGLSWFTASESGPPAVVSAGTA